MLSFLSEKRAILLVKILALVLAALLSIFAAASLVPEMSFVKSSLESVEESRNTVMRFSAATLSTSLAISALPDDFATPLADSMADINVYFVAILVALFLEKLLVGYGMRAAFMYLIPTACGMALLFLATKRPVLKGLAVRLCVLGLTVAFVVPCSTYVTGIVASELTEYVNETIAETEEGAGKLNEAMEGGTEEKTIFETLSDLFQSAINGISDLMQHFKNTIRRCMNSIAILILTNCLMPLLTFFILKRILEGIFQITIPMPSMRRHHSPDPAAESVPDSELASTGGKKP